MFHLLVFLTGSNIIPSYINALAIISCELFRLTQTDPMIRHYCSLNVIYSIMLYSTIDIFYGLGKNYTYTSTLMTSNKELSKKLYMKKSSFIHHVLAVIAGYSVLTQNPNTIEATSFVTALFEISTVFLNIYSQTISDKREIYIPKFITKDISIVLFFIMFVFSRFVLVNYAVYYYLKTKEDIDKNLVYTVVLALQVLNCYWVSMMVRKFLRKVKTK